MLWSGRVAPCGDDVSIPGVAIGDGGSGRGIGAGCAIGAGATPAAGAVCSGAERRAPQNLQKSAPGSAMPRQRPHTTGELAAGRAAGAGAALGLGMGGAAPIGACTIGGVAGVPIEKPHE
jgi:hypothetical protein